MTLHSADEIWELEEMRAYAKQLEARTEAAEKRVKAAEYEAKRYCQDVAEWHERAEAAEKRVKELERTVRLRELRLRVQKL